MHVFLCQQTQKCNYSRYLYLYRNAGLEFFPVPVHIISCLHVLFQIKKIVSSYTQKAKSLLQTKAARFKVAVCVKGTTLQIFLNLL